MYPYTLPSGLACELREMTGAEEELLTNARLIKSGDAYNQVMRNCLVSLGGKTEVTLTDVLDLLAGDRNVILVRLRQISLGDELTVSLTCPKCKWTSQVLVNLEDLPVTPYPPEREFTTILPGSGQTVRFVPMDGHMQKRLMVMQETNTTFALLIRIRDIDGAPPTKKLLVEMSMHDRNALRAAIAATDGDIDTVISTTCEACGTTLQTPLTGEKDFFYPGFG
jgi:hypothetical protein